MKDNKEKSGKIKCTLNAEDTIILTDLISRAGPYQI